MNGVVAHYQKIIPGGITASGRIASLLAQRYGFPIVDSVESLREHEGKRYEYCIVVSSAPGFAPPELRDGVAKLAAQSKEYIYAQNDFIASLSTGQTGKMFAAEGKDPWVTVWSTIPKSVDWKWGKKTGQYVNFNMLTWDPRDMPKERGKGLMYYGAHRRERVEYFKRWLDFGTAPATVSTSTRVYKKWQESVPGAKLVPQMDSVIDEMCALGSLSLYIEDEYSHKHYCSPANRLYEMLSAGMPFVIDRSALGTLEKAGYDANMLRLWAPRFNQNVFTFLTEALDRSEEMAQQQRELMGLRDYRAELEAQICSAEKKVGLHAVS